MFQQRQLNDIYQLIEISFGTVSPGAITTGSKAVVTLTPVVGSSGGTTNASIALGDSVEIIPSAAVGSVAGLIINAYPTATQGQIIVSFYNATAGTITPTSGTYTFIAKRYTNTLI